MYCGPMKLPAEVWCEIMGHLDLNSLITLLRAYQELRGLVALLTDFELDDLRFDTQNGIERIQQHSIREVLPDLAVHNWKVLGTRTKTAPVKIVEIALTMEPSERIRYWKRNRPGALPEWVIWERLDLICAHLNRHCFVRLVSAPGMDIRHIKLGQACERVGAKLESSFIPCLDFELTVNKATPLTPDIVSQLKSVHIQGLHRVEITTLPSVLCLFVELERPTDRRALLRLDSAPRLRSLTVHYKGTSVPELDIGRDVFPKRQEYNTEGVLHYECDLCHELFGVGNRFELVCSMDPSSVSMDSGSRYRLGRRSFNRIQRRCCCVVLDGVPDWVVLLLRDDIALSGLVWKRWRSAGPLLISEQTSLPLLSDLYAFQFFTDIENYGMPGSEILQSSLEKVVVHTTAHGLELNCLLNDDGSHERIHSVTVIAPPYSASEHPILFDTDDHRQWTSCVEIIYTEGHIEYEWMDWEPPPDDGFFMSLLAGRMDLSTHINYQLTDAVKPLENPRSPVPLYMASGAGYLRPWKYWHLSAPNLLRTSVPWHYSVTLDVMDQDRVIMAADNLKVTFNGSVVEPNVPTLNTM